jgi:Flp pilus assembly protein TadD
VHEARQHLEELTVLRRDPRDWFLLAVTRQRLGDVDGAIAALERVRQIDPAEPETYDLLAELYSVRGDAELAQTRREQARSIRAATAARN